MNWIDVVLLALVGLISYAQSKYYPKFNDVLGEFRIIGGRPAKVGEFRAQVSLQNNFMSHICAGTLVDPLHIVTAAHCRDKRKPVTNVMGDDLSIAYYGADTRQRRKIINFVQHPEFNHKTFENDIAVIRVDEPFNVTNTFGPMRRAESTPKIGTRCTAVGWGYTSVGEDAEISFDLLKTDVFVADINFCNSSESYEDLMKPGMFCAGRLKAGGHDACGGDSGGLLTCGENKELCGVISYGNECGLAKFPGIYADVAYYKEFIDQVMSAKILPKYDPPVSFNGGNYHEEEHLNEPNGCAKISTFAMFAMTLTGILTIHLL